MPTPVYPPPIPQRSNMLQALCKMPRSFLSLLFTRSYEMKMGEISLPKTKVFFVNQPELVRQVMVSEQKKFPKHHLMHEALLPLLGESIFTTNGEQWRQQRTILSKAFASAKMTDIYPMMNAAVDDLLVRLEQERPKKAVLDIDPWMTFVTADIIFRTIMSTRLKTEQADKILAAFSRFQSIAPLSALLEVYGLGAINKYTPSERSRKRAARIIRQEIKEIIHPRFLCKATESAAQTDILTHLLNVCDDETGQSLGIDELVDHVCMLFLAGHETSASALTWSLYLLALDQDVQRTVHNEIDQVLGDKPLEYKHLRNLPILESVFQEALRLYPPVAFLPRECTAHTKMRNKDLNKNDVVMISPWLIHRHQKQWQDPHEFKPQRFHDPACQATIRHNYLPFGMGPRICLGAGFARQEALIVLAKFLKIYHIQMPSDFHPDIVGRLTVRSANGLQLVLEKRG